MDPRPRETSVKLWSRVRSGISEEYFALAEYGTEPCVLSITREMEVPNRQAAVFLVFLTRIHAFRQIPENLPLSFLLRRTYL